MERMEFMVQGSKPDPYRVTLDKLGSNLNAFCTCAAGSKAQYCKHVFHILFEELEGSVDPDLDRLRVARDWLVGTDVEAAHSTLAKAEDDFESAKTALAKARKQLTQSLRR